MNNIELCIQEKEDFCLCSVLQAVFKAYGINLSQKEISTFLTPGKERGFIADDKRMKEFLCKNGFEYSFFWKDETPFNEPDELLKRMSKYNGIMGIKNHVYLVKNFNGSEVSLMNPFDGKGIEVEYLTLLKKMGETGFFGLIKYID
jgi:hypothetical protein